MIGESGRRFAAASLLLASLAAGCGGGSGSSSPAPAVQVTVSPTAPPATASPTASPTVPAAPAITPVAQTATVAGSGSATLPVLSASGVSLGITLPAQTGGVATAVQETLQSSAPSGYPTLQSLTRSTARTAPLNETSAISPILYWTLQFAGTVTLTAQPTTSVVLPTGYVVAGQAYYAAFYDPQRPQDGWQSRIASCTATSATTLSCVGVSTPFTFNANVVYAYGLYAVAGTAAAPTPGPSVSPTAVATASPFPSPTATGAPTATPSPTPSPTASPTVAPTATAVATPAPVVTSFSLAASGNITVPFPSFASGYGGQMVANSVQLNSAYTTIQSAISLGTPPLLSQATLAPKPVTAYQSSYGANPTVLLYLELAPSVDLDVNGAVTLSFTFPPGTLSPSTTYLYAFWFGQLTGTNWIDTLNGGPLTVSTVDFPNQTITITGTPAASGFPTFRGGFIYGFAIYHN